MRYFEGLGFEKSVNPPIPCFQHWRSEPLHLEILLFAEYFSHETDAEMLLEITNSISTEERFHANLVLQEYTGHSMEKLFKQLYANASDPRMFRNRILFDVSYGIDSGCMTNMSQFRPFLDAEGNFYNLLLLGPQQLFKLIGKLEAMDRRILSLTIQEYKSLLNSYHVDYRRMLRGETLLFGSPEYTNNSTPDEIMLLLSEKLSLLMKTLHRLRHISYEDQTQFHKLLDTYKEMDVYKWYDAMSKIVPLVPQAQ